MNILGKQNGKEKINGSGNNNNSAWYLELGQKQQHLQGLTYIYTCSGLQYTFQKLVIQKVYHFSKTNKSEIRLKKQKYHA